MTAAEHVMCVSALPSFCLQKYMCNVHVNLNMYTLQKMFLLAFSFANFETTRGGRGKANIKVNYTAQKSYSSIFKICKWKSEEKHFLGSAHAKVIYSSVLLGIMSPWISRLASYTKGMYIWLITLSNEADTLCWRNCCIDVDSTHGMACGKIST